MKKKKILKFLNLNYSKKINIATCNGIPWIGDKLSQTRTTDGSFNKNIFTVVIKNLDIIKINIISRIHLNLKF